MIKSMPKYERPREKLLENGVESLSNIELLAVIIKNGTKGKSAIELSKEILYSINELHDLKDLELLELTKINGIGKVKAMEILCAIELGKRIAKDMNKRIKLKTAYDIFIKYRNEMDYENEHFVCLYLDMKCQLLTKKELFIGSKNSVIGSPNEIIKYALKIGASSIIILHNHPSGDPTPSNNDINFTEEIKKVSCLTNIALLDHIIFGNTYFSFNENGII